MKPKINADGTLTLGESNFTTEQVEQLIHDMLLARSRMEPPVPQQLPQDRDPIVQFQPAMEVSRNPEGITLAMRSAGLGWVVYSLPERQAHFLVAYFTKRIGRPPVDLPDIEVAQGQAN